MSNSVLHALEIFLRKHRLHDQLIVVGVSGGVDSLVLLHSLMALREKFSLKLHVAHLNHQLRGRESLRDAVFVEAIARDRDLPVTVEAHDVAAFARAKKLSVEEAARMVRYGFLEQVAEREGATAVAVAHQADDQIETILMHFIRGAGMAGLRGMQPITHYPLRAPLKLLRPLLEVSRAEIEAYSQANSLQPRVDATNEDKKFLRNRVRHELLPLLETYNPNFRESLHRNTRIIADDYDYLRDRALGQWQRTLLDRTAHSIAFSLSSWRMLKPSLKRMLIRMGVMRLRPDLHHLDAQHVENALRISDSSQVGSRASLPGGIFLFRDFDAIILGEKLDVPALPHAPRRQLALKVPGHTQCGGGWQVTTRAFPRAQMPADALKGIDPLEAFFDADKLKGKLALRGRTVSDVFKPLGMNGHSKLLTRFMIDAKIPAHWREHTPLVVVGDEIIWVTGWRISETVRVDDTTQQVLSVRFSQGD